MSKEEIIYLAIPYTWNPEESFKIANIVAAKLMLEGYIVFSPISHSHPISGCLESKLQTDFDFWIKQDLPILRLCDKIIFVVIGVDGLKLIEESKGCQEEKMEAIKYGKKIEFIKYNF